MSGFKRVPQEMKDGSSRKKALDKAYCRNFNSWEPISQ